MIRVVLDINHGAATAVLCNLCDDGRRAMAVAGDNTSPLTTSLIIEN